MLQNKQEETMSTIDIDNILVKKLTQMGESIEINSPEYPVRKRIIKCIIDSFIVIDKYYEKWTRKRAGPTLQKLRDARTVLMKLCDIYTCVDFNIYTSYNMMKDLLEKKPLIEYSQLLKIYPKSGEEEKKNLAMDKVMLDVVHTTLSIMLITCHAHVRLPEWEFLKL